MIDDFATTNSISPSDIGIRLVHCYDSTNNVLYLRMQICVLDATEITDHERNVYELNTNVSEWYELREGTAVTTLDHNTYDSNYLNYFYYSSNPLPNSDPLDNLATDGGTTYVRNLVFPWSQIAQMYANNSNPSGADIHFAACSYTEAVSGDTAVEWPHTLVLYLSTIGGALLDNTNNPGAIFENKGADGGTLCPPKCDVYIDAS